MMVITVTMPTVTEDVLVESPPYPQQRVHFCDVQSSSSRADLCDIKKRQRLQARLRVDLYSDLWQLVHSHPVPERVC